MEGEKSPKKSYLLKFRMKQGQMASLSLKQRFSTKGDLVFLPSSLPLPSHPWNIWQCLETLLVVTSWGILLASRDAVKHPTIHK